MITRSPNKNKEIDHTILRSVRITNDVVIKKNNISILIELASDERVCAGISVCCNARLGSEENIQLDQFNKKLSFSRESNMLNTG